MLRLGHKADDETECQDIETSVEAEGSHDTESREQTWKGDGENGSVEETGGDGPAHADFAMREREDLGGVGKGDGALAGGIKGSEEEDEEGDHADMCFGSIGDEEAEACSQQGPSHLWEGKEQQRTASPGVDSPDGGPGEDEIDRTKAPGSEKGFEVTGAGFDKDGGGVEGYDIDTAHLLGDHDSPGGEGGATHTGDGEELDETGEVVAVADDFGFFEDLRVNVVEITGSLEAGVTEAAEGLEGLTVALFLLEDVRFMRGASGFTRPLTNIP